MEHPIFFAASCCSPDTHVSVSPQGEMASIRADVPGGRVRRMLRRDRKSYPGEGGDSHGEESKGREEEGCEEAIACPRTPDSQLPERWGLGVGFLVGHTSSR